MSNNFIVIHLT